MESKGINTTYLMRLKKWICLLIYIYRVIRISSNVDTMGWLTAQSGAWSHAYHHNVENSTRLWDLLYRGMYIDNKQLLPLPETSTKVSVGP